MKKSHLKNVIRVLIKEVIDTNKLEKKHAKLIKMYGVKVGSKPMTLNDFIKKMNPNKSAFRTNCRVNILNLMLNFSGARHSYRQADHRIHG